MFELFEKSAFASSRTVTQLYSTSFSRGISALNKKFRNPIYGIYGFVRFADEIVDTFHQFPQQELLDQFRRETHEAIERKISLNPVLYAFQKTVHQYGIEPELIDAFFSSMQMDLDHKRYDEKFYTEYIYGSAEVVGLMCLKVFSENDHTLYERLRPYAQRLGAAFQKVNFLRDVQSDFLERGRIYFPQVDFHHFSDQVKQSIEREIEDDFSVACQGIKMLPNGSRFGVYLAYIYYRQLFKRIRKTAPSEILKQRIRVPDLQKMVLIFQSYFRYRLHLI